ncbi:hypothetical protein BC835DRAFT_1422394 [Cytidiella melzeri]|nr:hypothetical protein BC835DRAFT_1422394 [Cytidiella melzeri]
MSPSTCKSSCKGSKGLKRDQPSLPPTAYAPSNFSESLRIRIPSATPTVSSTAAPTPPSTLHHTAPIVAPSIPLAAAAPDQALYMPAPPSYMQPSFMPPLPSYPGFQYPATTLHAAQAQYPHPYMQAPCHLSVGPAPPVPSARRTSKGKSAALKDCKLVVPYKHGRKVGAKGYKEDDKLLLAQLVLKLKPTGPNGWRILTNMYNRNARTRGLLTPECKALRVKFNQSQNQLVKARCPSIRRWLSKPTSRSRRKWQALILTTTVSNNNVVVAPPVKLKANLQPVMTKAVSRKDCQPVFCRTRATALAKLLSTISATFDPKEQQAHNENCFALQLQLSQLNFIQAEVHELCMQLSDAEDQCHKDRRRADALKLELILNSCHPRSPRSPLAGRRKHILAAGYTHAVQQTPIKCLLLPSPVHHLESPYKHIPKVSPLARRNATPGPSRPTIAQSPSHVAVADVPTTSSPLTPPY